MKSSSDKEPILSVKNIIKRFGVVTALNDVCIDFFPGEIHGLAGENGSGKSTLSSIIAGKIQPADGNMFFHGKEYHPSSMINAQTQGVGMILQEQGSIAGVSIAQNLFVGKEKQFQRFLSIRKKAMYGEAVKALSTVEMENVDPAEDIETLNMQDQKLVEVAKIMYGKPEILIVDETTTALSLHGKEILYRIIKSMRRENKMVILISHDLQELMNYCDRITVLRDGVKVATVETSQVNESEIKRLMVGRTLANNYYRADYDRKISEEVVLEINDMSTGYGMLEHFSMKLHKGELVGIGGLSHCGIHELGKGIFGATPLIGGQIIHTASNTVIKDPLQAIRCGIGYVSKDRDHESLVMDADIQENIAAVSLDKLRGFGGAITPKAEKEYVSAIVEKLSIKCSSIKQDVKTLSGGNKQKVAFGKWIGRDVDILILDCPTRGVDIGVKAAMYKLMDKMLQDGKSIIMISEELPELIGMSDRIVVLKNGKISAWYSRSQDLTESTIIESMV